MLFANTFIQHLSCVKPQILETKTDKMLHTTIILNIVYNAYQLGNVTLQAETVAFCSIK